MRNIIITGGGMVNKGAQAMTFITVDALRKRYPNHRIYLYSETDRQRPESEKSIYSFDFTGWYPLKFAQCQNNSLMHLLNLIRHGNELYEAENLYRNTDLIVDISGYALGSNWSDKIIHDYLDLLEFANSFQVPVYLLPQSFGPFEFGKERTAVEKRMRLLLSTVKMIYAREQEGYDLLTCKYHLTNVMLADDIVLTSREISYENVFREVPQMILPNIPENSVAIIPNDRNFEIGNAEELYALYCNIIDNLRCTGKNVYLLAHSTVDLKHCREIKNAYSDDSCVVLLEQDFSCIEFNELVKKFRFLIASRFHSVVHAYKNGIPCIVLGWAVKYHDLLVKFGQEKYMFDVRENIDPEYLINQIHHLDRTYKTENEVIRTELKKLQNKNIFDSLPELS